MFCITEKEFCDIRGNFEIAFMLNTYMSWNIFFLTGVSFARHSLGKATVFVQVFLGICYIQHYHIFTSSRRICDYKSQYHLGEKGKLTSCM